MADGTHYYENTVESDWTAGSPIVYRNPDGSEAIACEVIEARAPTPLAHPSSEGVRD